MSRSTVIVAASVLLLAGVSALPPVVVVDNHLQVDGTQFIPRGSNYIRLNGSQGTSPPLPVYHSTFSPLLFNGTEAAAALTTMRSYWYNTVRVFIDPGENRGDGIGGEPAATAPLSSRYLDNVATWLSLAEKNGIYTLCTLCGLPSNVFYRNLTGSWEHSCGGVNCAYTQRSFQDAKADYVTRFVSELGNRLGKAGLNAIFAIELENEQARPFRPHPKPSQFVQSTSLPWSAVTGTVHLSGPNASYDMADPTNRQAANDDALSSWVNRIADHFHKSFSSPLLTLGLFTFQAVGKQGPNGIPVGTADPRFPGRPVVVNSRTRLDVLDVHVYPKDGTWNLASDLASSEFGHPGVHAKPIMMGEFGAFRSFFNESYVTPLVQLELDTCGYGISGWLCWTWDTWEQPRLHYMTEQSQQLAKALSPMQRKRICSTHLNLTIAPHFKVVQ